MEGEVPNEEGVEVRNTGSLVKKSGVLVDSVADVVPSGEGGGGIRVGPYI